MASHNCDRKAGMNCLSCLMAREASRTVEIKTMKEITDVLRKNKGDFYMPFWKGP